MYYFKDHLNFSNNLQDNLYILRQRQLKEAAWSPSSGGPAVPESAAGTNELKDRMRNIKQSGDRPQSKEFLEMDAEVKRREGRGSSGIPQSSDVKTDRVAGDWVERYARKLDMDPRKVENIRRGVIDMDTSGRGEDPISQTQDQVAQRGVEAYDRAKQYVVDMQKRDADKKAKTDTGSAASSPTTYRGFDRGDGLAKPEATPPTTPSSRPYYDRGEGLAKPEATTSVTPEDAQSARTFAVNRMTGEGQAQQIMRARQYTDNPVEYSLKPESAAIRARQAVTNLLPNRNLEYERSARTPSQDPDMPTGSYSPKPEYTMPGLDPTEPQSFGTSGTNNAPGQPYVVPGSQDWNNMSDTDQEAMIARAFINNETHKFTGGRRSDVKDIDQVSHPRFSEDSGEGGPSAATTNERSKIANAVIDRMNQAAQAQKANRFNRGAGVAENDPNYIYSRGGYAQSPYSPEEPKPAEDTRPTSGRQLTYPGAFQDILDRMQNTDRSKKISLTLKDLKARRNFNR